MFFLLPLLICRPAIGTWAQIQDEYDFQWAHSLYPPYVDSHGDSAHWTYDAFVSSADAYIRLTANHPSRKGYIVSKSVHALYSHVAEIERRRLRKYPYVGAMVNDGRKYYSHGTDGANQLIGGCHAADIVNSDGPVRCKVIYSHGTLQVQFFDPKAGLYNECFKATNLKLPKAGYLAFSASTGSSSAEHDLLSVTTATFSGHLNSAAAVAKKSDGGMSILLILGLSAGCFYLCYLYVLKPLLARQHHGKRRDPFQARLNQMYGSI